MLHRVIDPVFAELRRPGVIEGLRGLALSPEIAALGRAFAALNARPQVPSASPFLAIARAFAGSKPLPSPTPAPPPAPAGEQE